MESDEKSSKWGCDQCTYLNFNKSIKCVMCGYPKTAVEIFR